MIFLYEKRGPLLLACLEEASGGVKPFVKIINSFMRYHRRNGTGGWREFMGMYERLSGIDLSNFALLYIDGPGLPPGVARPGWVSYSASEGTTGGIIVCFVELKLLVFSQRILVCNG